MASPNDGRWPPYGCGYGRGGPNGLTARGGPNDRGGSNGRGGSMPPRGGAHRSDFEDRQQLGMHTLTTASSYEARVSSVGSAVADLSSSGNYSRRATTQTPRGFPSRPPPEQSRGYLQQPNPVRGRGRGNGASTRDRQNEERDWLSRFEALRTPAIWASEQIDPSRKRLDETLAMLEDREKAIEAPNAPLANTREQLESANEDIDSHELELNRLTSMSSLQGSTYKSIEQQMKAVRSERDELSKQLNASKGQAELANDTITRLRTLLDNERQTSAGLRKSQGWAALQEEKKAAAEVSELEKQRKEDLQNEIHALQETLRETKEELRSVQEAAVEMSENGRQEKKALQDETKLLKENIKELREGIEMLQNSFREMEGVLASVRATAGRTRKETS
ncbi:hypothetical protein LTR37_017509 [Vermiconidia calcicola]|uniref:Uncharacterized protein n=1 Tax=Vermiconidia calcicola TaxID=1690605 RepID=A0ACC3MKK4_9PEZI|nr:hypothetical protein LTR37_017509 [Vermiconidia calcicola]